MSPPNKAAQTLGALGGKARAKTLSKARKREIARLGGIARAAKTKGIKEQDFNEIRCPDPQNTTKRYHEAHKRGKRQSRTKL